MRINYEDLMNEPSLLHRLREQAHRERAKAVHRLIVAPIARLFAGHAARPQVARMAGCSSRTS